MIYGLEILKSKNYNFKNMKKRDFLKTSATLASTALLPSSLMALTKTSERLRTAHVGVGNMGAADLASIECSFEEAIVQPKDTTSGENKELEEKYTKHYLYFVSVKNCKSTYFS